MTWLSVCTSDKTVERAVRKLAQDQPDIVQVSKSREHHMMEDHFSSLHSSQGSPLELKNKPHTELIR